MFLAFVTMLVVGKVLRANTALECPLNGVEDIRVGRFHLIAIVAAVWWLTSMLPGSYFVHVLWHLPQCCHLPQLMNRPP